MLKKVLVLLNVLIFSSLIAMASSYFAPEWSEFCPREYQNLENKKYIIPDKNYWLQRRLDFESKKQMCALSSSKEACYDEIRKAETNKNNLYYREKELQQQQENSQMLYNSIQSLKYKD